MRKLIDVLTEGELVPDCNAEVFSLFGPVNSVVVDLLKSR